MAWRYTITNEKTGEVRHGRPTSPRKAAKRGVKEAYELSGLKLSPTEQESHVAFLAEGLDLAALKHQDWLVELEVV